MFWTILSGVVQTAIEESQNSNKDQIHDKFKKILYIALTFPNYICYKAVDFYGWLAKVMAKILQAKRLVKLGHWFLK